MIVVKIQQSNEKSSGRVNYEPVEMKEYFMSR